MSALFNSPRFVPFRWRRSWAAVHEAGHVATALLLGCAVYSARIDDLGGSTFVGGNSREMVLVSLSGRAAELVLGVRDSDIRCSTTDIQKAFSYALAAAREEERLRPLRRDAEVGEGGSGGPALAHQRFPVLLTARDVAGVERNASRVAEQIAARWTARAGALVDAAEVEVHELLSANRRGLALIAERLEEHGRLDAADVIGIAAEAGLEQTDRRNAS